MEFLLLFGYLVIGFVFGSIAFRHLVQDVEYLNIVEVAFLFLHWFLWPLMLPIHGIMWVMENTRVGRLEFKNPFYYGRREN